MTSRGWCLLWALVLPTVGFAAGQANEPNVEDKVDAIDKALDACMKKSGGVTLPTRECLSDANQAMDAQLNVVYRRLMSKLGRTDAELLRDAQRKWLAFKEAEFTFANAVDPIRGTLQPIDIAGRHYAMLKDRTKALQRYLSDVEQGGY